VPRRPRPPITKDPNRNLLEIISTSLQDLRPSDRKVAELTLAAPDFVLNATVDQTARRSGVSEPTVIRFCEALGFLGFQDFKVRLAQSVALGMPATHSVILPADSVGVIADKIFDYSMNSLDWARKKLDKDELGKAVDLLLAANRIEFFGFGASGIVALDAQQKFPLFGVPCTAHCDSHQQFIASSMMKPGDVVVAISNTGQTKGVIEAAKTALANGAAVIAITGKIGPLVEHCTVPLLVETLENTDVYTPTISRLAALTLIDILATSVVTRRGQDHNSRVAEMKRNLAGMRGSL
jgi:RpiR family transcriptional regulator, carbohydrate utilization regulator